jgi:hypothetical protein
MKTISTLIIEGIERRRSAAERGTSIYPSITTHIPGHGVYYPSTAAKKYLPLEDGVQSQISINCPELLAGFSLGAVLTRF